MGGGNSIGKALRVTTFGESHGKAVGAVVDGVPAGLPLSEDDVRFELQFRRPGGRFVSSRREPDEPEILSGVFSGRTTGSPVAILVRNVDVQSAPYEEFRYKPRPGHADLSYVLKYGLDNWDYRGGGRASARETVARVAAGAIAKKLMLARGTMVAGYLASLGPVDSRRPSWEEAACAKYSPLKAPDPATEARYAELIKEALQEGDSWGGVAEVIVMNPPPGLGEPVFDKLKADLAKALMSIPAAMGFEVGQGFAAARVRGSEHKDNIVMRGGRPGLETNRAGGMLGGISVGEPIVVRVAFKPTSSIRKPSRTVDLRTGEPAEISVLGRHDPAVAVRGVAVAESMVALVVADHMLRSGAVSPVRLEPGEAGAIEEGWSRYRAMCSG
ncbi:chorismate synthase [Thermocladium modestius]|uniref:Chorismate synthase n=1 Tax=Thermocladium modestius TaxID=62609 RepID=A0A830GQN6_9CREN|nr:chorismate synthase [Thermocladium modestius]GGP18902.1 chorismate synthase [Thermocladium modestius]